MKITNRELLPRLMVEAVTHDRYDPGDRESISVTTLINPPQQRTLRKRHEGEIKEDASDRVWSMLGSACHYVIENAEMSMRAKGTWDDNNITEERFYYDVDGRTVSAQIDLYENGDLNDFKVTSVWTIMDAIKNGKPEWDAQLNVQRYLMQMNGHGVGDLSIIAIARDWNKSGQMRDPQNYPPKAVRLTIPMWSMDKTEDYIKSRLVAHFSDIVPECTPKECWEKPTKYALMKKGRQSALRVLDSEQQVMDYAEGKGLIQLEAFGPDGEMSDALAKDHYIEVRPGERTRCKYYCDVAEFCDQYRHWREENEQDA